MGVKNKKKKVLIVEDSIVCAEIIKHILETDNDIKVVAIARNGKEAIDLVPILKPDIITMDIHMPEMNGLEATEHIMAYNPTPILIVSSSIHEKDTELAFHAISAGALDVLEKPDPSIWEDFAEVGKDLISKVKFLSEVKVITHIRGKGKLKAKKKEEFKPKSNLSDNRFKVSEESGVVVIGASTGGPHALAKVLSKFSFKYPFPVVVAQHISEGFIGGLVSWLQNVSHLEIKEVSDGEELKSGTVYISAVEKHTSVVEPGEIKQIEPIEDDYYRPSIDLLFSSAINVFGKNTLAVILTGMGSDGAKGAQKVNTLGGYVIAQDEKTSRVFGMPKSAIERKAVNEVLPVDKIGERLGVLMQEIESRKQIKLK